MPELTPQQLKSVKKVSPNRHRELTLAVKRHLGRPKKSLLEKENPHSIRFSEIFLRRLKKKAHREGFRGWQTYAKKVLESDLAND